MMLKPLNKRIRVLLLTTFLLIMTTPTLAKNLEQQLISLGLSNPRISISDQEVTLSYIQIRTQMGSFSKELKKTADIIKAISETHLDARLVKLRLISDNDQITVISGTPNDAHMYLSGQYTTENYVEALTFEVLTRNPPLVPGTCEPGQGDNCRNTDACACYPNEVCAPDNPQANKKGCVEKYVPQNAHLVGAEYVCNKGYEWNTELTGCVQKMNCPQNAFKFEGRCYCNPGYQPNPDSSGCIQVGGGSKIPVTGKPQGSTTWESLSAGSAGSTIGQALLLDSIPPTSQNQKTTFSPGDMIYVWLESRVLNEPHKLEIVWIDPSGGEVKRETFDLRGWGARETVWSELQTGHQMIRGRWKIKFLIDGRVDQVTYLILEP